MLLSRDFVVIDPTINSRLGSITEPCTGTHSPHCKFRLSFSMSETDIRSLFDYFIGAQEKQLWIRQAERLCRREIDDKLEFGGLLDRNIAGLRRPSDQRYSIATVRPSTHPSSPSRAAKAAAHGAQPEALAPRNPIVGSLLVCCADVLMGHVAVAPTTSVMNSRRLILSPPGKGILTT